jgi:hypothetical protein
MLGFENVTLAAYETESTDLLGSHEEEVLHCMGDARHVFQVAEAADIDIQGRAGLVCFGIVYQEHFKLVLQGDDSVGSIVQSRTLEVLDSWARGPTEWFRHCFWR